MRAQTKHERLLAEVPAALAGLLDVPIGEVTAHANDASFAGQVLAAAGQTFVVEWSGSPGAGPVAARAEKAAQRAKGRHRRAIPLVAVPFMSEAGRRACEAARVPWFDLSGNAHIVAPRLRIIVEGRPNRFRGPGRPASLFAPKSARVVRWLLMYPERAFTQREIARSTAMTEGFVSRIASRLEADSYVIREPSGALRAKDPQLLLDAWREEYQFSKHNIIRGHVSARSGDALARFVSDTLVHDKVEHAATGLAAAWQLTHFAAFRIATFFVTHEPSAELKAKLGFRDDARGANLWLVVPNDAGVFHGAEAREGLRCVHPVQAYLDLKGHPERAAEAAERLRTDFMSWKRDV
ncbi:MAG TPA: type IV toxin-antitoxin system AbiEi family antitoxin [Polyangiales bacterium]